MDTIRTTLFLPVNYHKTLKSLAHEHNTSMAKLIQSALEKVFFSKPRQEKTAQHLCGIAKRSDVSDKDFRNLKRLFIPHF